MSYDPMMHGARCAVCPLATCRQGGPVPPEDNPGATFAVVGDAPGDSEAREGRPFVGPAGAEITKALSQSGVRRGDAYWTTTVLCQPPGNDLKRLLAQLQSRNAEKKRENAQRAKEGRPPLPLEPSPVECCKPRLAAELARFPRILLAGGTPTRTVTGATASILDLRGGMMAGRLLYDPSVNTMRLVGVEASEENAGAAVQIMPTLSPGFVLRAPKWTVPFRTDVSRAMRWFRGVLGWTPPRVVYQPSPDDLAAFLLRPGAVLAYDYETDGIEPLSANVRCIGIGDADTVYLVGIVSKDGQRRFYSPADEARIHAVLRAFFADPQIVKVGHNAGSYDRMVVRAQYGIDPEPTLDTILLHRLVESELPHNLAFVGSVYTDIHAWKCYDGETEVLTPGGWVRFDALPRGVPVAEWTDGVVRFAEPLAYVDQPYTGKAWRLTDQATDLLVTPDHKMIFRQKSTGRLEVCMVQDLPATGSLPHTGMGIDGHLWRDPDFIRLLVAMQADGSWVKRSDGWGLDFGFTKPRKIERLTALLTALGIAFTVKATGAKNPRTRVWVEPCGHTAQLRDLLGANKVFPPDALLLARELREAFLDELPLWDGTKGSQHTNYNTTEKANADLVQALAVTTGRAARMTVAANGVHRPIYRVSLPSGAIRSREWSKLDGLKREEIDYDGRIYCVSVPSGFLLVRRNGKVTVSGNTDREGRKLAFDSETDEELHAYCALDVAVTARVLPPLYGQTRVRAQDHLIACDHRIQKICCDMHTVGMFVDQNARAKAEKEKLREVLTLRDALRDASGIPDLNPGSTLALRRLLFREWDLNPTLDDELRFTASGDPSTSDDVVRACLAIPKLRDDQRAFLKTLRNYRSAQKMLGTYIVKLRPMTDAADGVGWDDEESDAEREEREKRGYEKRGIVWPDGRMRPGYNAHVTVSGRLSSSKPINAQNFPKGLRAMVRAQPGHVLVGADADQLELRIAAARWGCKLYLDAFAAGADPHSMTAMAVFGDRFIGAKGFPEGTRIPRPGDARIPFLFAPSGKWTEDAYRLRNLAKMVQYASQYAGSVETVHRLLQQTEDDTGELVYLGLTVREVRHMHGAWLAGAKEFPRGWDEEMAFFRANNYIAEPVMGRRRDCLNGASLNEIVNFPIQGAASSLINRAMIKIADAIPLHKWGPGTGLITQTHDALVVECPQDTATYDPETKKWTVPEGSIPWRVQRIIEEAMNQTDESLPGVAFTATADVGFTWKEVG